MKYALALVALLTFMAGQVVGQALAPVQAEGGGFWPLVIVGVLALVGVGLYLWHKRNPSQADAAVHQALTTAKDDAFAVAHKLGDALQTLTKTNREQAMVIASPPVQAAVNAGAYEGSPLKAPTPGAQTPAPPAQIAPQATAAPDPVPTPTAAASIYPATNNFPPGDPRNVREGESPEAYWTRTQIGGYGKTTEQLVEEQNKRTADSELGRLLLSERYTGPVPVSTLTDAEKAFLLYVTRNYRFDPAKVQTQNDAFFAICSGTLAEINFAIGQGDALAGHGGYDPASYPADGRMRLLVDHVANGLLKPVIVR